jgi:hypothetical protein
MDAAMMKSPVGIGVAVLAIAVGTYWVSGYVRKVYFPSA